MSHVRTVHDDDFGDVVLGAGGPVLVDFHADWCAPCVQVAPVLETLATELPWLTFTRVDVDRDPVTPAAYRVCGLPTLLVFDAGEPVLSITGSRTIARLRELLETLAPAQPV